MITLLLSNKGLRRMCAFTKPIRETFVVFQYRDLNKPIVLRSNAGTGKTTFNVVNRPTFTVLVTLELVNHFIVVNTTFIV